MNEKHWYQDGWLVLVIVAVASFISLSYWHNTRKATVVASRVTPELDVRFNAPILGSPTLDVDVWHLRPEILKNIQVILLLKTGNTVLDHQSRSLVEWAPNREHQVSFSLKRSTKDTPVSLTVFVGGRNNQTTAYKIKWQDGQWQADLSDSK